MPHFEKELEIKNRISHIFLTIPSEEMYGKVLPIILKRFSSALGYFGYISDSGDLICPSMTMSIWEICKIQEKDIIFKREEWGGGKTIWGRSIEQKRAILSNESFNTPVGHLTIENILVVPIIFRNSVIGQIALANKPKGFHQDDIPIINDIANFIAPLLSARLELKNQRKYISDVENSLKISESKYIRRIEFYKDLFTHDVNNILQSIKCASDLLFFNKRELEKGKKLEFVKYTIDRQVARGARLVSNINTLSKTDENGVKLRALNALDYLNNSITSLKKIYFCKSFELNIENSTQDTIIYANKMLIDIFDNILLNAIRFNNNDCPRIDIRITEILKNSKKYLKFEFRDNGIGISEEMRKFIIGTIPEALKKEYRRVGLGLLTVQRLITLFNGELVINDRVKQDPSKGTNIIILLPKVKI
ncbi:MAG: GAF domain-containing protein [Candidatus Lokiarchaeota archaeon]|nr:GAF domain-containing protein [Candidatus Lokiarchaeota archaeon]MBD3201987.1 GAF domain-containing protein [Candidatus Lokiarchaeota archaeon]